MRSKETGFIMINLSVSVAIAAMVAAGAGMTALQIIRGHRL